MPEESFEAQEPLRGIHVLLVEDDPDSRQLLKTVLEYAGALVSLAFTARGALRALEAMRPDILLCDLVDAVEADDLITRARRMPQGADLPFVALSAQRDREDRSRALGAGFGEHLAKPVDPWELCRVLAMHARRRP